MLGGGLVPGLAGAARRRSGHRQVDAAAAGGGAASRSTPGRCSTSRARSRSTRSSARGERLGGRRGAAVPPRRDLPRAHPRGDRPRAAAPAGRRLDPDGLLARARVGAGQHRPGARGARRSSCSPPRGTTCRRSWSATSPRTAASPARRCSSTWSTRCSTSRASATTRTASCARSRTASAPSNELGVFEMTGGGLRPVPNPSSCSSPSGRPRRRDRRCCAASRARGRCWSKCRRWSARPPTARRGARPSASTPAGCRCCWRCSRSAPGSVLVGDDVFVNVAGGMTVDEPATDLAVLAALASSVRNRPIPTDGGVRRGGPGRRGARRAAGGTAAARGRASSGSRG